MLTILDVKYVKDDKKEELLAFFENCPLNICEKRINASFFLTVTHLIVHYFVDTIETISFLHKVLLERKVSKTFTVLTSNMAPSGLIK